MVYIFFCCKTFLSKCKQIKKSIQPDTHTHYIKYNKKMQWMQFFFISCSDSVLFISGSSSLWIMSPTAWLMTCDVGFLIHTVWTLYNGIFIIYGYIKKINFCYKNQYFFQGFLSNYFIFNQIPKLTFKHLTVWHWLWNFN